MKLYNSKANKDWPGGQGIKVITRNIRDNDDVEVFIDQVTASTIEGRTIKSCGVNGTPETHMLMWAILTADIVSEVKE